MKALSLSLAILLLISAASANVSYEGHQVWRIRTSSAEYGYIMTQILERFEVDVWNLGKNHVDIRVKPNFDRLLDLALKSLDIKYDVMIQNVQTLIDEQTKERNVESRAFDLLQYHTFSEIEAYLGEVAANSSLATLSTIGTTYEGRDQHLMIISAGSGKPAIWIDCGIHAREWITPATCLYGIDMLVFSYGTDTDVTTLLDTYDIYMVPVYNPDGYDYTWTDDRMWRKNRVPNDGSACYGVDLNRNFEYEWGGEGSSDLPCASTYRGTEPASEMETKNSQGKIQDLIANNNLRMIFTIHSYSQYWMYAFGYTSVLPTEVRELDATAQAGVEALTAVYGTPFVYGTLYEVLYPASGTTVDYGYSQGVIHSYLLELRDTGEYGFLLPEVQIGPTAEETWAGLIVSILFEYTPLE